MPGSQEPENSFWHAMSDGKNKQSRDDAQKAFEKYVSANLQACTVDALARALHAVQDSYAPDHRGNKPWSGMHINLSLVMHGIHDSLPASPASNAYSATKQLIDSWQKDCSCAKK